MDVHVYSIDLVSIIFWSAFAHDTQVQPQASWCGGHQLQLLVTFLQQKDDVLFLQDNAPPHMAAVMQLDLRGVQQLPQPARTPDLSPIEHVWDMMNQELTLSPEPATTIAELWKRVQDVWDNLLQDDIWHLYDLLHARIQYYELVFGGVAFFSGSVFRIKQI